MAKAMYKIRIILGLIIFIEGCNFINNDHLTLNEVNSLRLINDSLYFVNRNNDSLNCNGNSFVKNKIHMCIYHELKVNLNKYELMVFADNYKLVFKDKFKHNISFDVEVCNSSCCHDLSFILKDSLEDKSFVFNSEYTPEFNNTQITHYKIILLSDNTIDDMPYHNYKLIENEFCD